MTAPGTTLVIATTNRGKLREIAAILAGLPLTIAPLDAFDAVTPPDETGETFAENARLKAEYYARALGVLAAADDSGLEIAALEGRPGVRSARYPGADYPERFANLYREMAASGRADRRARFVCAVALAAPSGLLFEAEGTVEGVIVAPPRGSGGFGYDPIFEHTGSGLTLAELPPERKAAISHRGAAFSHLRAYLADRVQPAGGGS